MKKLLVKAENLGIHFPIKPQTYMKDKIISTITKKIIPVRQVWSGINFEIYEGDMVSIIGKNGRGKSTLLKIIAGLLQPDEGKIIVNSKKVLLLAAGLGFAEQLTGRDNIYYAGIFLGMTKKMINEKFDEIVKFAELEEHIDKPFGYYSDGMKARLVFSLATSATPDILMLDELLSAGDISFHEKATKRMHELFQKVGCSILVTHSIEFAKKNSTKILYIGENNIYFGDPDIAIKLYKKEVGVK